MHEINGSNFCLPVPAQDVLTSILRDGAQQMLARIVELEVAEWLEADPQRDAEGRRQVVRNGYLPERTIVAGLGEIAVKQPRVRNRRPEGEREPFHSKVLSHYLRKTKSIEELIPCLYLKGIGTGRFNEALQALLGPDCPRFIGDDDHAAQSVVGAGARGVVEAIAPRQGVRLRVGRRHP